MTTGYKMNSCPPPLLYLSPVSPILIPSLPKYLYSFLFTATPVIREKGVNSLPVYGMLCHFQPLSGANPLHVSSQAHNIELSSEPKWGETEEICKMCRLGQGPCQAALLDPGLRLYNLTWVFLLGPCARRANPHLRLQVWSTAHLPTPSSLETQRHYACCSSGSDLGLKAWNGPCLVPSF